LIALFNPSPGGPAGDRSQGLQHYRSTALIYVACLWFFESVDNQMERVILHCFCLLVTIDSGLYRVVNLDMVMGLRPDVTLCHLDYIG